MKKFRSFKVFSKFEFALWIISILTVCCSFGISSSNDYLTLTASLIGVTALIFVAKGYVIGQILTVIFAVFYGFISFHFSYYGEMITYLGMTSPIAVITALTWYKHPYQESLEVAVNKVTRKQIALMFVLTAAVTAFFYFVLLALHNSNLMFGTISIATSFIASYLTLLRSPYYALGYMANDIVLIILWCLAAMKNPSYLPMVACFAVFFLNDLYGFFHWSRMKEHQHVQVDSVCPISS